MAIEKIKEEQPVSFIKHHRQKIRGMILLVMALCLAGALASYNNTDPSFDRASDNMVTNYLGSAGAYIADPIIQFTGLGSILLVFGLAVLAIRSLIKANFNKISLRLMGMVFSTVFLCGMLSLLQTPESWPFYIGIGGFFGDLLKNSLKNLMGKYTYISVLFGLFIASSWFVLDITYSELKFILNISYKIILTISRLIKRFVVVVVNLIRISFKKEPIQLKVSAPIKVKAPIEKAVKQEIVEVKKNKTKKAAVAVQKTLNLEPDKFNLPDLDLLNNVDTKKKKPGHNQGSLEQNAKLLKKVLDDFGINGEIIKVRPGPVVTLYELEPSPGTKSSRVIGLSDDIARSMSSVSARISVVPGRNILGIELPNAEREMVFLRELIETEEYQDKRIKLPLALGKDISGGPVVTDLSRMPHLLIAGTTGSGKSVAVNAMILSFLYRLTPEECRFIMIDPKMLELSVYDGIPHLLAPVVTEPQKAVVALKWAVKEMEERYRSMSNLGVRNVAGYNKRIEDAIRKGEKLERKVQTGFNQETGEPVIETMALEMKKLPYIVVIVDEMADLMLTAGKDIESSVQRLAQMARAAGIHLIMATQRPSVDVITGVIKANFPTRISFQVTSRIDSRTILGEMGAEQLLGMGDMLYMAGGSRITRVHGPFVDDKEVESVVNYLKNQGEPSYIEDVTKEDATIQMSSNGEGGDELYDQAVAIVLRDKKASISYVQRQLKIGYNRAANLIERMENEGILSAANHTGKREILVQ